MSTRSKTLAQQAETARQQGGYQTALDSFNQAIALQPGYHWALAHRAETYLALGDVEAAIRDFSAALQIKPDYVWGLAHRGVAYRRAGQLDAALADFNRVLTLKPDYPWALVHRAQIHIPRRAYTAGLADIERAMALDPQVIPYAQGEHALLLNYMGRYAESIATCQQAVADDPADYIAWYSLLIAATMSGQTVLAAELFEPAQLAIQTACDRPSERALALYRLGGLAILQQKADLALDYLQQAMALEAEPRELVRHDPVWHAWREDERFRRYMD